MSLVIKHYEFNPTLGKIIFKDYTWVVKESIDRITNTTAGIVIYELDNPAKDSVTGDTLGMIDTAGGMIFSAPDRVVAFPTSGGGGADPSAIWNYSNRTLTNISASDIEDIPSKVWEKDINNSDPNTAGKKLKDNLTINQFIALQ